MFFHYQATNKALSDITSSNNFADNLKFHIESKCDNKVLSDLVFGAVYLDPRLSKFLNSVQRGRAVVFLYDMYQRLEKSRLVSIKVEQERDTQDVVIKTKNVQNLTFEEKYFMSMVSANDEIFPTEQPLYDEIENLPFNKKVELSTDPIKYWNENMAHRKSLSVLFKSLFNIPVTQVSVERAFSDLGMLYSNKRTKLNSSLVGNMLFLRINRRFDNDMNKKK